MKAIAEITGGQYILQKGDVLQVEMLSDKKAGDKVKIENVLLKIDGDKVTIGTPYIDGASVELLVKKHGRGEKIRVYKMKAKKRYHRTQGHRQWYSEVEVLNIK